MRAVTELYCLGCDDPFYPDESSDTDEPFCSYQCKDDLEQREHESGECGGEGSCQLCNDSILDNEMKAEGGALTPLDKDDSAAMSRLARRALGLEK